MPSGRAAFMERMEALMTPIHTEVTKSSSESEQETAIHKTNKFKDILINELGEELNLLHTYQPNNDQQPVVLAVINEIVDKVEEKLASLLQYDEERDKKLTYASIQKFLAKHYTKV